MKSLKNKLCASIALLAFGTSASLAGQYPNFPEAFSGGGGAIINNQAYVGLGSVKEHFYSLDLAKPESGWQQVTDFIGGGREQPVVASVNGKLYVFGGLQKNVDGVLKILTDVYEYNPETKKWTQLDTHTPFSLVGASSFVHDNKVFMVGGVNLSIFNGLFEDLYKAGDNKEKKDGILSAYFDKPAEDYFFNRQLFSYNPETNSWKNEGIVPFSGRAGAAVSWLGDKIVVANGEIKPGLRTDEVSYGVFNDKHEITWEKLPKLIPNEGADVQEGVAGAYAGVSNNNYLITGGANFVGSRKQYADGMYHAHKGLSKAYHDTVFTLTAEGNWKIVGKLPQPLGYGVTFNYNNQMLVVGGKNDKGNVKNVYTLTFANDKLTVE